MSFLLLLELSLSLVSTSLCYVGAMLDDITLRKHDAS